MFANDKIYNNICLFRYVKQPYIYKVSEYYIVLSGSMKNIIVLCNSVCLNSSIVISIITFPLLAKC